MALSFMSSEAMPRSNSLTRLAPILCDREEKDRAYGYAIPVNGLIEQADRNYGALSYGVGRVREGDTIAERRPCESLPLLDEFGKARRHFLMGLKGVAEKGDDPQRLSKTSYERRRDPRRSRTRTRDSFPFDAGCAECSLCRCPQEGGRLGRREPEGQCLSERSRRCNRCS